MRIGIDCRMFRTNFTGIGRYTSELIKNLQALSAQPLSLRDSKVAQNEYVLFFNDPEFDLFTPTAPNFKKVLVNAPHYSFKEQTHFLRLLNKENLDLMHFTHFNAPILYKKPFIVTIHDLTHTLFPGRKMQSLPYRLAYKIVVKNAVRRATFIIAVSNNTKQDIIKILKIQPTDATAQKAEKIHVIYEGANEEFRKIEDPAELTVAAQTLKETYGITKPFLLYTGVHRYHKNLQRLIEAFAILMANRAAKQCAAKHENLLLVITGKPDPLYPEAEQEVAKHNLQKNVIFTGLVPEKDLIALYNLSTAYVFPSLYEGFGLPILEAFACGTPVVASNVSSIPEVVGNPPANAHAPTASQVLSPATSHAAAPNALLFDPTNTADMAEKIDQLLKDEQLQKDLAQNGLERVKDFSWEKMARSIADLYNSAPVR